MSIGKQIAALRLKKQLSQPQLARQAAIPLSTLNYVERGVRKGENLSLATAIRLARALDVSMDVLCLMEESPDHSSVAVQSTVDASFTAIASHFWSRVWRCDHDACNECCWPWNHCGKEKDEHERWVRAHRRGIFLHPALARPMAAHRLAYMLAQGAPLLLLPSIIHIRHAVCDYVPCCNPRHLAQGSHQDNMHDKVGKGILGYGKKRKVTLPDGTCFSLKHPGYNVSKKQQSA